MTNPEFNDDDDAYRRRGAAEEFLQGLQQTLAAPRPEPAVWPRRA